MLVVETRINLDMAWEVGAKSQRGLTLKSSQLNEKGEFKFFFLIFEISKKNVIVSDIKKHIERLLPTSPTHSQDREDHLFTSERRETAMWGLTFFVCLFTLQTFFKINLTNCFIHNSNCGKKPNNFLKGNYLTSHQSNLPLLSSSARVLRESSRESTLAQGVPTTLDRQNMRLVKFPVSEHSVHASVPGKARSSHCLFQEVPLHGVSLQGVDLGSRRARRSYTDTYFSNKSHFIWRREG